MHFQVSSDHPYSEAAAPTEAVAEPVVEPVAEPAKVEETPAAVEPATEA